MTGRSEYTAFKWWNATFPNDPRDFVSNPDGVVAEMATATIAGLWDFVISNNSGNNRTLADADNMREITHRLTGGDLNTPTYKETNRIRMAAADKLKRIFCP